MSIGDPSEKPLIRVAMGVYENTIDWPPRSECPPFAWTEADSESINDDVEKRTKIKA